MPVLPVEQGADPAVVAYLNNLRETAMFAGEDAPGSFLFQHAYYASKLPSRRISSRGLAILIIVLGASLPLISVMDKVFKNQKFWVPFIGAAIVVTQGINQTLQSTHTWENYTVAMLSLEHAHHAWQNHLVSAAMPGTSGGVVAAEAATETFSDQVAKIVMEETRGFFAAAKQPNAEPAPK